MADDPELVSTVEWGATPPERQTWMDRLTAGSAVPSPAAPGPRFRPSYPALGLAVVGFLVEAGAQYLPWLHLNNGLVRTVDGGSSDLRLDTLPIGSVLLYGFSMIIGLGLLGVLLFTGAHRRVVGAATVGVFAGNALTLIALSSAADTVAGQFSGDAGQAASLSGGFYLAVVALLLLIAAAVTAAPERRPRRAPDKESVEEPMDLTVTGLGGDIG